MKVNGGRKAQYGKDAILNVNQGPVGQGSKGSAEPINFQRWVLEPIIFEKLQYKLSKFNT